MAQQLLTTEELATYLHCSRRYIYAINAELPKIKIGKRYMYDPDDIAAWLSQLKKHSNSCADKISHN